MWSEWWRVLTLFRVCACVRVCSISVGAAVLGVAIAVVVIVLTLRHRSAVTARFRDDLKAKAVDDMHHDFSSGTPYVPLH